MFLTDTQKRTQFETTWRNRLKSSKYKFEWWGGNYSNRQVPIGSIIQMKEEGKDNFIRLRVIDKPYYMDRYNKARYLGYIICKEVGDPQETIIIAHTDDVKKVLK